MDREPGTAVGGTALGPSQSQELATFRMECQELRRSLIKMCATAENTSEQSIPDLRGALRSLEAKVDVLTSHAPTDASWEAVSEKRNGPEGAEPTMPKSPSPSKAYPGKY